ncbi:ATP-binding protein [Echinicola jeungdonensis]|uniref:histidine kinase n=1 Tax=Echinicola jeungdonensis TaxID=709343 RepID=A0ABV5J7W8_9BACT|nr:ATP-binding protein [Echinicola jeungdonensis]MDN3670013.1 ATP-binding protein [Echinicola jeungdonensis]
MRRSVTTRKAKKKVILGFLLALFLVLSVSAVTYFSLEKLLNTVESLSEPSERVRQLNGLLADIYQFDKLKGNFQEDGDSISGLVYLERIEERLNELEGFAQDSSELRYLKRINYNVNELVVVYNGLKEVKLNLMNRNFSREALSNIETKIKRQEEINRLQSLGQIRLDHKIRRTPPKSETPKKKVDADSGFSSLMTTKEKENLRGIFQQFRPGLIEEDSINKVEPHATDSILYAVKKFLLDINSQERHLRSNLADLEAKLNEKNKALIADTQKIISNLQYDTLEESREKNESLYDTAFSVSVLLGILVFVGIVGSSAFIYSILAEMNKDENYRIHLEKAKERSDNLAKTKQNFLANMSHEIRNPLHAIQGYQAALRKTSLSENQRDYNNMVGFAADTLSAIVNDILDFSKLEADKVMIDKSPFDPHKLFRSIQSSFELKAKEKQIEFNWELDLPENKWLLGDELRINQILNNLIGNSLKFTEKGRVDVIVSFDNIGVLEITVADTGIGMTEEFKSNVFTEFNQGDSSINRKYGGTGLGLAIVKRIVDLMKGEIQLESKEGEGTSIYIKLPIKATKVQEEALENVDSEYDIRGLNVLLVDDDPLGLRFAKLLLESNGAVVHAYQGGLDFKENFREVDFDLALLDIQMPEISGYQVLEMLRNNPRYKNLVCLAITANVFVKEKEKIQKSGFDAIVLKPFKEEELIKQIGKKLGLEIKEKSGPTEEVKAYKTDDALYDLVDLQKFCMGDEGILQEVLIDFCETTHNDLNALDKALKNQDWESLLEISHKLGSRLGQLKINAGRVARKLEQDLKEGKTESASSLVKAIITESQIVLEKINEDHHLYLKTS